MQRYYCDNPDCDWEWVVLPGAITLTWPDNPERSPRHLCGWRCLEKFAVAHGAPQKAVA